MAWLESLEIIEEKKRYIADKLNPILEDMVVELLAESPSDLVGAMLKHMEAKHDIKDSPLEDENKRLREELTNLKKDQRTLAIVGGQIKRESMLHARLTDASNIAEPANSDDEEEDDDDDDYVDDIPERDVERPRGSVSAEAYGEWNTAKAFQATSHTKTPEQRAKLTEVLSSSFMFVNLEKKDLTIVIDAMEEVKTAADKKIITLGDAGDYLFVVEKGSLKCTKQADGKEVMLKKCEAGDVFGELALLYNCPRAADVTSCEECILWKLDRETFNMIVRDSASKKREKYQNFLSKCGLLETMDVYERSQVADALRVEEFPEGTDVCVQGSTGDKFYIVEEGTADAIKDGKVVMNYKSGDFFGEMALMYDDSRLATIRTTSEAKLLSVDRRTFKRMIGGLQDILTRAQKGYVN